MRVAWTQVNRTVRSDDPEFDELLLNKLEAVPPRDKRGRSLKRYNKIRDPQVGFFKGG
jgi:hypothetical protein